mgnify:FL=1
MELTYRIDCRGLIRAYLLTKDRRYADEAVKRVKEMATWGDNKNVVGDFNEATLLSLCSMAYDALYDVLTDLPPCTLILEHIDCLYGTLGPYAEKLLDTFRDAALENKNIQIQEDAKTF